MKLGRATHVGPAVCSSSPQPCHFARGEEILTLKPQPPTWQWTSLTLVDCAPSVAGAPSSQIVSALFQLMTLHL